MTYIDEYGNKQPVFDEWEAALAHEQSTCDSTCDYCMSPEDDYEQGRR